MLEMEKCSGPGPRYATCAMYFIGGFLISSWGPLVPLVKARLGVTEDILGLLLLCIGIGSLVTMPFAGTIAGRFGCRRVLGICASALALLLALVSQADSLPVVAGLLLLFGAAFGTLDVTSNIQAVVVEQAERRSLMPIFHAMWSVGGFIGAAAYGLWACVGITLQQGAVIASIIAWLVLGSAYRKLLRQGAPRQAEGNAFAVPHGIVALIGIISFTDFLVEGAMMDWGGLYLMSERGLDLSLAGTGFAAFSVATLLARLLSPALLMRLGNRATVIGAGGIAIAGFLLLLLAPQLALSYVGFALIGAGLAPVIPVFFSLVGVQKVMPVNMAMAAVGTMGYVGVLLGPALLGFIAHRISLWGTFSALLVLTVLQTVLAARILRR